MTLAAEVRYIRLDHSLRLLLAFLSAALIVAILGPSLPTLAAAMAVVGLSLIGLLIGYRTRLRQMEAMLLALVHKVTGADPDSSEVFRSSEREMT